MDRSSFTCEERAEAMKITAIAELVLCFVAGEKYSVTYRPVVAERWARACEVCVFFFCFFFCLVSFVCFFSEGEGVHRMLLHLCSFSNCS